MSNQVQWDNSLAVGVDAIDDQHQELIVRLARFLEGLQSGVGKAELIKLMGFLQVYVNRHFEDEENLQLQVGFPDYPSHKQEHGAFKKHMIKLNARVLANGAGPEMAEELKAAVVGWLVNHIKVRDQILANFIKNKSN